MDTQRAGEEPIQNSKLNPENSGEHWSDEALAVELRKAAFALVEAMPDKIESAPLNQVASALKTTIEVLQMIEPPDETPQEQVIRWEFVYDGAVHEAPPWARDRAGASGAVPGAGVRAAVG